MLTSRDPLVDDQSTRKAGAASMRLVLPIHSPLDSGKPPLFVELANKLTEEGVDVIPVTEGWYSRKFARENFCRPERVSYDIVDFVRLTPRPTEQEMRSYEEKYGSPNFMQIYYASRGAINARTFAEFRRQLVAHIKFWENLIETEKPSALLDEIGGLGLVLGEICRTYGVTLLNVQPARMSGRTVIKHNVYDEWERVSLAFRQLKQRSLTAEERRQAVSFLDGFLMSRVYPNYVQTTQTRTGRGGAFGLVLNKARKLHDWTVERAKSGYLPVNPVYVESVNWLVSTVRYQVYTRLAKFWDTPVHGEKYVLFPLQYQPEASLGVWASFFCDQVFVAEILCKALPMDYKLYVREAPSMANRGLRATSFYKEIKKNPQARLISPLVSIHDLIENAALVVVLSGTTGLEALFYEKPVIVLGNPFYKFSGLCYTVENLNALPNVVKRALEGKLVDREILLKFIVSTLQGTYGAEFFWGLQASLSKENVTRLCDAVLTEMKAEQSGRTLILQDASEGHVVRSSKYASNRDFL
jgi:hypothetical protein